jgi:hypothetical protein
MGYRRLAEIGSLLLLLGACTPQMAEDALSGQQARCAEAQRLYDKAPGVWAGVLTATACAG